LKPFDR